MPTQQNTPRSSQPLSFTSLYKRKVHATFDAGRVYSDGGVLLLREVNERFRVTEQAAACFQDDRHLSYVEHSVKTLIGQRVLSIALGYEDVNDHDVLKSDQLLAVALGCRAFTGASRSRKRDRSSPLASPATLNRIENCPVEPSQRRRDQKISCDTETFADLFVHLFIQMHEKKEGGPPKSLILDLDATDDILHGKQEDRFYHGYYRNYCYLPLYIFIGDFLLVAKLRPSNIDGSAGSLEEVQRIVGLLNTRWPKTRFLLRGDSGFCRESLMAWCETHEKVDYLFGCSRNPRLEKMLEPAMALAEVAAAESESGKSKVFTELVYKTLNSWSRSRRIVGKAEVIPGKRNPRFVVTSLSENEVSAEELYRQQYCPRGEMENRIKEQQLGLFADRTSASAFRANQLRLWFSSLAYVLVNAVRVFGLRGTELARAQVWTIREKLFKVGCILKVSCRRVLVQLSEYWPYRILYERCRSNLMSV